jgi:succinate dehydrogenase / fumarate reductase, cytochrome b subunit
MGGTASNGAPARGRPLSPYMTIYRMSRYCLLTSISNRIAGAVTSLGLPLLAYWLTKVASGAQAYSGAQAALAHPALQAFYALLLLAFAYHLVAGIRHLIWDTGRGLERGESRASAWVVIACSLALAAVLIWWALFTR